MKKILYLLLIPLTLISFSSCEDDLDRLWENPNKLTPSSDDVISGLFTPMQKTRFWIGDYGEWYYVTGTTRSFLAYSRIIHI
mgnify:FL=1